MVIWYLLAKNLADRCAKTGNQLSLEKCKDVSVSGDPFVSEQVVHSTGIP